MTAKELVQLWYDLKYPLVVTATLSAEDVPMLRVEGGANALFLEFDGKDFIWPEVLPREPKK